MKKLLILIMLATIMVTLTALPVMASACGGCLLPAADVIVVDSIVAPYVVIGVSYTGAPGGAIVSKRGTFYIDSHSAEVILISSGGGGGEAAGGKYQAYMTIRAPGKYMIPYARDMTGLV